MIRRTDPNLGVSRRRPPSGRAASRLWHSSRTNAPVTDDPTGRAAGTGHRRPYRVLRLPFGYRRRMVTPRATGEPDPPDRPLLGGDSCHRVVECSPGIPGCRSDHVPGDNLCHDVPESSPGTATGRLTPRPTEGSPARTPPTSCFQSSSTNQVRELGEGARLRRPSRRRSVAEVSFAGAHHGQAPLSGGSVARR